MVGVRLVAALVMVAALTTGTGPLHPGSVKLLVLAYTVYAAGVLVANWRWPASIVRRSGVLHGIDMTWAAVATTASGGVSSHVFPFFTFVLATAAFRWGMWRTLVDAGVVLLVASAQSLLAEAGLTRWVFEWDVFVVQSSLILALALLLGAFAEREHALRFLAFGTADLVSRASRAPRLNPAVRDTLVRGVRLFGASRMVLAIEETDTGVLSLWQADTKSANGVAVTVTSSSRENVAAWFPAVSPGTSCYEIRRLRSEGEPSVSVALDATGTVSEGSFAVPSAVAAASPWTVLMVAPVNAAGFWSGHVYVFDPTCSPTGEHRLRFLQKLITQVTPALLTLYLLRRLRRRAESIERLRISRELHAGTLQSLAAVEMRLELIRRHTGAIAPAVAADVVEVRDLLHDTAIEARELMHRLRSPRVDARRLPGELEDLVERFRCSTEIEARFVWAADRLYLPPYQCSEVVRLVQQALFSARRDSGTTRVLVRMQADACAWVLTIEDNGQLASQRRGPRGLRERVVALGGILEVSSSPEGTRLEMMFPRTDRADAILADTGAVTRPLT